MLLFAIPNGANLAKKKNKRGQIYTEINKLKGQGLVSGVADCFLSISYDNPKTQTKFNGMYIEFKIKPNKQSAEQALFQKSVEAQGFKYALVFDYENFKKIIKEYLW